MTTYRFSDLIWSKDNLIIRGNARYRLCHIMAEPSESDNSDYRRASMYLIKSSRTHELICSVVVPDEQVADFETFQNAVQMSSLNCLD